MDRAISATGLPWAAIGKKCILFEKIARRAAGVGDRVEGFTISNR
jgi:hypothetical protein